MKTLFKFFASSLLLAGVSAFLGGCVSNTEKEPKEPVPVRILVSGAVMLPGQKVFWINDENPKPPTLWYVIGLSGGPRGDAYIDGIAIIREGLKGGKKREIVNLREIIIAPDPKKKDVPLSDGDIVEVYSLNQVMQRQ